jgi:hypothetical protein
MKANLAKVLLREIGEPLSAFDGLCGELADLLLQWLDDVGERGHRLLYLDRIPNSLDLCYRVGDGRWIYDWRYHVVVLDADDYVHDAWSAGEHAVPFAEYMNVSFPGQRVGLMLDGEDYGTHPWENEHEVPEHGAGLD